jgi:hypothetical protein
MIDFFLKLEPLISNGMSQFQMDKFVINEQITPYKKLKQAIIEAKSRLETQTITAFDLEEMEIKLKQAQLEEKLATDDLDRKLKNINVRKTEFTLNRTQIRMAQLQSESQYFLSQVESIVNEHFGSIEQAVEKMSDNNFHYEQESDYWNHKLSRGVYSDLINFGTISKGVLEAIACLSNQQQQEILSSAVLQQLSFHKLLDNTKDIALVSED